MNKNQNDLCLTDSTLEELKKLFDDMFVKDLKDSNETINKNISNEEQSIKDFIKSSNEQTLTLKKFLCEDLDKKLKNVISEEFKKLNEDNKQRDKDLADVITSLNGNIKQNKIINILFSIVILLGLLTIIFIQVFLKMK